MLESTAQVQSNLSTRPNSDHLPTSTTNGSPIFNFFKHKVTSEQQPPVNNSHYYWVLRVFVVHRFDCTCFNWFRSHTFLTHFICVWDCFTSFTKILVFLSFTSWKENTDFDFDFSIHESEPINICPFVETNYGGTATTIPNPSTIMVVNNLNTTGHGHDQKKF